MLIFIKNNLDPPIPLIKIGLQALKIWKTYYLDLVKLKSLLPIKSLLFQGFKNLEKKVNWLEEETNYSKINKFDGGVVSLIFFIENSKNIMNIQRYGFLLSKWKIVKYLLTDLVNRAYNACKKAIDDAVDRCLDAMPFFLDWTCYVAHAGKLGCVFSDWR